MDDLDHRLIAALRVDGRAPLSELAKSLGVSRGTIQNRLDRLIASDVILGFTVRVKGGPAANQIRAIMMIEVAGKNTQAGGEIAAGNAANPCAAQHERRFRFDRGD